MSHRISYAFAVLLLLTAAALRLWNLNSLPAGFSDIEFEQVRIMQDGVQRGDIRVFYQVDDRGQEGLYHTVLALSAAVFGEGTLGLRIVSVFAGMVSIALVYSLAARTFGHVAALFSAGVFAFAFATTLLSRLVIVEAFLPLMVAAVLLAITRALPVYYRVRPETSYTIDFAAFGTLTGIALYLHPAGLLLVLVAVIFIAYCVFVRRLNTMRQVSYTGFALLMMIIMAMPYVISTIRLPELDANSRIFGNYGALTTSLVNVFASIAIRGDANPLHNLPDRPLLDPVSAVLMLIGLIWAIRAWRQPRFGLLLIAGTVLSPIVILAAESPNFYALSVLFPVLALLAGAGIALITQRIPSRFHWIVVLAVLMLLGANTYWTGIDLFTGWADRADVQTAFNADLGSTARHLDVTAHDVPTVVCDPLWNQARQVGEKRSRTERILMLMNNDDVPLRPIDCREGLLFVNAGAHQQVLIAEPDLWNQLSPDVTAWLALGTPMEQFSPVDVIEMRVQQRLEDALGVYTTTTPASYPTAEGLSERVPVAPPIRFGGNITWLGYEIDPAPVYRAGDTVSVHTYWRIEGLVPSDLLIFTHILSDPVTIAANRDTLNTDANRLSERDVYLHIANITLPNSIIPGEYVISAGTYQSTSDLRLPVFGVDNQVRGDRLFLYPITITGDS